MKDRNLTSLLAGILLAFSALAAQAQTPAAADPAARAELQRLKYIQNTLRDGCRAELAAGQPGAAIDRETLKACLKERTKPYRRACNKELRAQGYVKKTEPFKVAARSCLAARLSEAYRIAAPPAARPYAPPPAARPYAPPPAPPAAAPPRPGAPEASPPRVEGTATPPRPEGSGAPPRPLIDEPASPRPAAAAPPRPPVGAEQALSPGAQQNNARPSAGAKPAAAAAEDDEDDMLDDDLD